MSEQPRVIETTYEGAAGEAFRLKQLSWTGFGRYESIDDAVKAGKALGKGIENMTLVGSRDAYDLYIKNPNKGEGMFKLPKLPGQEDKEALGPLRVVDRVAGQWAKATYDTPLSDVPIIGLKSSLNPLGSFFRKRYALPLKEGEVDKGLPTPPKQGPPLPRLLNLRWPWERD